MSTAKQSTMRRFLVVRAEDVSGTSGTGVVAEGVQFSNGTVVVHWLSQLESTEQCPSIYVFEAIHGHGGKTQVQWFADDEEQGRALVRMGFDLAKEHAFIDEKGTARSEGWINWDLAEAELNAALFAKYGRKS